MHHEAKELYVLLTRWGRIGDTGQYQRTPFLSRDEAVKEFTKVFKSKSGNAWKDVKRYGWHINFILGEIRIIFARNDLKKNRFFHFVG